MPSKPERKFDSDPPAHAARVGLRNSTEPPPPCPRPPVLLVGCQLLPIDPQLQTVNPQPPMITRQLPSVNGQPMTR